jgi:eukaryotic-like serine/threonine-protein kinase
MAKLLANDGEGERLDRFELVAELASGGMATVYLARLSGVAGFQRLVAIKRLHPHLAKEPEFIEMFLDEARLAARIHHPNVVPIQEVGESAAGYYLVMDYVEGDTLARLLARAAQAKATVPWGVTIRILLDTLAGLHAAHELSDDLGEPLAIVHRDVSPQNILVGLDGIARITDFGVARAASRLSTTRSGQLKGKLAYMAPEQARGGTIDRRADVFSCGIVLWEALALKRLFKGDGEAATLNRVLYDPIAPPSSQRAGIPATLEAVCMKSLERDIDARFATAEAFADELERVARSLSCVGSVREVAAFLEEVFGSDLAQQRDAVRAWLARSEPSGPPRSRRTVPDSVQTRVERGRSEPSGPRTGPRPLEDVNVSVPALTDQLAVTAPALPEGRGRRRDNVSSVSSAVLHVSGFDSTGAAITPPPRRSRAIVLGAAAVLVLGGVGSGVSLLRTTTTATSASGVESRPSAPTPTFAPTAVAPATAGSTAGAASSAVASAVAPVASATVAASSTSTMAAPRPSQRRPAAPRPGPVGTTSPGVSDDLSKNPYR